MKYENLIINQEAVDDFGNEFLVELANLDVIRLAIPAPHPEYGDLEFAQNLADLIHLDLRSKACHSSGLIRSNAEMRDALICLRQLCMRLGVSFPEFGFRDLISLEYCWKREGIDRYNRSEERVEWVNEQMEPLKEEIHKKILDAFDRKLLTAVSPYDKTGWPEVDGEIAELRARFRTATTPQACAAIGTACVRVNRSAADAAYLPSRHTPGIEKPLPLDKDKNRCEAIIETELRGSQSDVLISYAKSVISLAHHVKHSPPANRTEAGIAADASIALANMLRRVTKVSKAEHGTE
jgi:hypothetical protein